MEALDSKLRESIKIVKMMSEKPRPEQGCCGKAPTVFKDVALLPGYKAAYAECDGRLCLRWLGKEGKDGKAEEG